MSKLNSLKALLQKQAGDEPIPEPEPPRDGEEGFGGRKLPTDPNTIEYWTSRSKGACYDEMPPDLRRKIFASLARRGDNYQTRRVGYAARK